MEIGFCRPTATAKYQQTSQGCVERYDAAFQFLP
jgi:hypothetical protein